VPSYNPSGVDKIVKISTPEQGICSSRYIDSIKLIFVAFCTARAGFTDFKGWRPLKFNKNIRSKEGQAIDASFDYFNFRRTIPLTSKTYSIRLRWNIVEGLNGRTFIFSRQKWLFQ
jgi:hypothetical protein